MQLGRGAVRLPVGRPAAAEHGRQRPLHAEERGHQPVLRLGQRPAAAHPVPRHRHLRGARPRPDPAPPRHPAAPARHLRRARPPGGDRAPQADRRHRRGAAAGAPVRPRAGAVVARPDQLLGLQHDRLPRPAQPLLLGRAARRAGRRVQDDGQGAAHGGHRGHPRRGLQPHRRGRRPRPHPVLPRHRQPRLLPPRRRQPVAVHRLHRLRQLAQRQAPALAPADHGLAALLGPGDARRRVPLRPGVAPWPGNCTTWTGCPRSSTWCSRTRWSPR